MRPSRLVTDPELSPLDLAIAPNGNIVVSSKRPFGAVDAVTSVREYDATDGHLVRVWPFKLREIDFELVLHRPIETTGVTGNLPLHRQCDSTPASTASEPERHNC